MTQFSDASAKPRKTCDNVIKSGAEKNKIIVMERAPMTSKAMVCIGGMD
jgi:hypothetical protein